MIGEFWKLLSEAVKDRPVVRAALTFVALYLMAAVVGYEYIQWRYGFAPPLDLYLSSYVFAWITLLFSGVLTAALLYRVLKFLFRSRDAGDLSRRQEIGTHIRRHWRAAAWAVTAGVLVLLVVIPMWLRVAPRPVRNITVKLLVTPDPQKHFDPEALAYIVYELNKRQQKWHFELDLEPINSSSIAARCKDDPQQPWCMIEAWSERLPGEPCIGISTQRLGGEAMYWQHLGHLSVITTFGVRDLAPLSRYDYLTYCLIVQGIAIHVDAHCGGAGEQGWGTNKSSSGDVLTIAAPLAGFKGTILAGRLSRRDRELLLRCFGPDYLRDCTELLNLDWLHSGRVAENLDRYYGVGFAPPPTTAPARPLPSP